jgi:putative flippase GtrA
MRRQLLLFAGAGVAGFLVDAGVLYLALDAGVGYFSGRAVSFLCAVWVTWQINRRFTFVAKPNESVWQEWWRYLAGMSGGGAVNYAAYSIIVITLDGRALLPAYAVAAGSLAGMAVNFIAAKWWVFER